MVGALAAGADVRANLAWSLLDNFEWAWGYSQRSGPIDIGFDSQEHRVNGSGKQCARIIAANRLPD